MIATFYSFRPEMGCTMAAVNVGITLAEDSQQRVLLVEWKSTANTLLMWLRELSDPPTGSLLDLLGQYKDLVEGEIPITLDRLPKSEEFIKQTKFPRLHYLPASLDSGIGLSQLKSFDWDEFYTRYQGGAVVERLRKEWTDNYDVVILVSEKGICDAAAICTMQLPDVDVIMMYTNIHQLETSVQIAEQAVSFAHKRNGRQVQVLPVPRVGLAEFALTHEFMGNLRHAFSKYLPSQIDASIYFSEMQIPEVDYYRSANEIAVLREHREDPKTTSFAYRILAHYLLTLRNDAR